LSINAQSPLRVRGEPPFGAPIDVAFRQPALPKGNSATFCNTSGVAAPTELPSISFCASCRKLAHALSRISRLDMIVIYHCPQHNKNGSLAV
jgi:hypothetical protein